MILQLENSVSRIQFLNPFYVIVHAKEVYLTPDMDSSRFNRVLSEIDFVRNFEEYAELDQTTPPHIIPSGIPRDRPILVGGFLRDICVREQRDCLRRTGYNAFICSEITY